MTSSFNNYQDCGPMRYKSSVPVSASLYENNAYPSRFRPRISKHVDVADKACWEACDDFENATGLKLKADSVGCINPIGGNVNALWFPEAIPERLHIISYLSELLFRHDDLTDDATTPEQFDEVHGPLARFLGSESKQSDHTTKHNAMNTMQARVAIEALEQDERLGKLVIEKWKGIVSVRGQDAFMEHKTLDSYMHVRHYDAGAYSVWSQILFCCDISLTDEELIGLEPLTWLAFTQMILWHDYCSWDKEAATYLEREEGGSNMSAVQVYMTMYDLDQHAAKDFLLSEITRIEDEYCERKASYMAECSPAPHITHYLGLVEMCMAGNTLWHLSSRRYDPAAPLPRREDIGKMNRSPLDLSDISKPVDGSESDADGILTPVSSHVSTKRPGLRPFWNNQRTEYTTMTPAETTSGHKKHKTEASPDTRADLLTVSPCTWPAEPDEKDILAAYLYTAARPASGARDKLMDALDMWYRVPPDALATIRTIVRIMHNASLMLDDVHDNSPVRRGSPSAHVLFGTAQTTNSASYLIIKCVDLARQLGDDSLSCLLSELAQLHLGQSHDLAWTFHCRAPSLREYYGHLEQKTGGLFRVAEARIMREATRNRHLDACKLMSLLGRLYQLRDDYQDMTAESLETYDDLDEGSFTLPLIHALRREDERGDVQLHSILQSARAARSASGKLSVETKVLIREMLEEAGSLEYTRVVIRGLYDETRAVLAATEREAASGGKNWMLRLLTFQLKV
ncbi:Ophiobolin F synthase [Colletotrichum orbiculare MAFF 240422]|uniref:Ophiobolin F synthase n=1 Tax=Colletotrichum orbiculare (strain 104-T / ATCC 96160 / CBS 514.97 / LARS 414 / MAFF 240422) TaxID=1213857 RepID=N4UV96_COLOR|nr:Ophiobolin F synthase [Colletotrichum orbiculare MAFF 240422]